jgi:peroxiredoxin
LSFLTNDPDELTKEIPVFAGEQRLNPGDPAPDFNLIDLDGNFHSLDQYLGKMVLLAFFVSW